MKPWFLIPLLFFSVPNALARTIDGTLLERGINVPVVDAAVIALPEKIRTTTDAQGKFKIEVNQLEKLVIQKSGFEKMEFSGEEVLERIYFEKVTALDYETTIVSQEKKDPSLRKVRAKEAVQLPGSASDAIKALQNLPGVNRTPGFSSQVVVQGSAPEDTRYAIDGHEVPLMFHFGGVSSVLMPELLGEIDFYTAGYQAPFGRALGGIINANTVENLPETDASRFFRGMAYFDIFNVGGAISTPVGQKSHLSVGARASYVGTVLKAIASKKQEELSLTVAPAFQDVAFVYESPLEENLRFKLTSILSNDSAEFLVKEAFGNDPTLRGNFSNAIQFFRFIPQLEWKHSARSRTKFSLGMGQDRIENVAGDIYFRLRSIAMTARGENETQMSPTWTQSVGFDHRYSWSDVTFSLPQIYGSGGVINPISTGETRTADLKAVKSHQIGLYWNHRLKTAEESPWTFYPGVRLDYFRLVSDVQLSPRFSTRFQLHPDLAFTLALGRYVQPPAEQFASKDYGNPNIKSTHAYHISLKGEKDLSQEWSRGSQATSGVFAKFMDSLIVSDRSTIYSNQGSGAAIGWENSVNYNFYPYTLFGAYTLSRSTRWDPSHNVYLSRFDQTHYLTLIGSVALPRNWKISARFRYVTGALTTPVTSGVYDADNDVYFPVRGTNYSERLDAFSSLDLRVDKRWVYDTWVLSFYLDIQNALNRSNPESVQYSYDYRSKVNVAGLPIVPTLGLKGEF